MSTLRIPEWAAALYRVVIGTMLAVLLPICLVTPPVHAGDDLQSQVAELREHRAEIRQSTLGLLSTLKQLDGVYESLESSVLAGDDRRLLELAADLFESIRERAESAERVIARGEATLVKLAPAHGSRLASTGADFEAERKKIRDYRAYAEKFYAPYAELLGNEKNDEDRGFLGLSSFRAEGLQGSESRDLALTGTKKLAERSELSLSYANQAQLVRSPYNSNEFQAGYSRAGEAGGGLSTSLTYQKFNDEVRDENDFGTIEARTQLRRSLGENSRVRTDVQLTNRRYRDGGGNGYRGIGVDTEIQRGTGGESRWKASVHSRLQSSVTDHLDFTRVRPRLEYEQRSGDASFKASVEAERVQYSGLASRGDYSRERLELNWSAREWSREAFLVAKQFPGDPTAGYFEGGGHLRWRGTAPGRRSSTGLDLRFTYFPEVTELQVHRGEARLSRIQESERRFLRLSAAGRFAKGGLATQDQLVDLFATYGWKFPGLKVGGFDTAHLRFGPILRAQLLYNTTSRFPRRAGNHFGTGLNFAGGVGFGDGSFDLAARYEVDFVFDEDPQTVNVFMRAPQTFRLNAILRVPTRDGFHIRFDADYYRVSLHALEAGGTPSRFLFLIGAEYGL